MSRMRLRTFRLTASPERLKAVFPRFESGTPDDDVHAPPEVVAGQGDDPFLSLLGCIKGVLKNGEQLWHDASRFSLHLCRTNNFSNSLPSREPISFIIGKINTPEIQTLTCWSLW